jgi:hypothetical protein
LRGFGKGQSGKLSPASRLIVVFELVQPKRFVRRIT